MYRLLTNFSTDGLLEKKQYQMFLKELIHLDIFTEQDDINSSAMFSMIFDSFDRSECQVVDVVELACGFSILCQG